MKHATTLTLLGIATLLGGILALANPFAAALSTEVLLGWGFLLLGAIGLITPARITDTPIWPRLAALGMFAIGIFMVANALQGLVGLTLLIGASLIFSGVTRLFLAHALRHTPTYWMLLLSGVISVLLGAMIFANLPQSAEKILGLFLGIELIMASFPMIAFGLQMRRNP